MKVLVNTGAADSESVRNLLAALRLKSKFLRRSRQRARMRTGQTSGQPRRQSERGPKPHWIKASFANAGARWGRTGGEPSESKLPVVSNPSHSSTPHSGNKPETQDNLLTLYASKASLGESAEGPGNSRAVPPRRLTQSKLLGTQAMAHTSADSRHRHQMQ